MSVNVADYLLTPVVPFTTLETISLPVTGPAGTVPVSLGIGNTTAFLPLSSIFGSAPAEAVIIDPATSARNTIQSTNTNATPLRLKAVAGQTVRLMEWVDPNEVLLGGIGPGGSCIFKGFAAGVNAKTANYTATGTDHTIPVNATAGPVAISLPPAAVASPFGLELLIIKTDASANTVTVQAAGGDTINGAATLVLAVQWDSANLTADGVTSWFEEPPPNPDLSGAVILAPNSVNRNLVIPTADANKGIIVKAFSAGQTANLFEAQLSTGASVGVVLPTGVFSCPGSGANSERFGNGSTVSGNTSVAIGNAASANGAAAVSIGGLAAAGGAGGVAVGYSSSAPNSYSTAIGSNAIALYYGSIALGANAAPKADFQLVTGSSTARITDVYIGSGVVDTTPFGFTLNATGGSGSNIAGSNLTIAGGKGTGNAKGGNVLIQTSPAGVMGSGLNPLTTLAVFTGDSKFGIFSAASAPVVQQAGASAAAIAAIIDGNAKSAVSALQNALNGLGWVTAPA